MMSFDCEDDPEHELYDHEMSEAEGRALGPSGVRNPPKIPVRSLPTRPTLHQSNVYRIHIETAAQSHLKLLFSFEPTKQLVESALSKLEETVPRPSEFDVGEKEAHDRDIARLENFIALVRLVPVLRIPTTGKHENHEVRVAGVYIGKVSIEAAEAWTL